MLSDFLARLFPVKYRDYIQSTRWRKKADACKRRAGYRCQLCNRAVPLQAHHRTYERLGYELPGDLIALCDGCHRAHHHKKG